MKKKADESPRCTLPVDLLHEQEERWRFWVENGSDIFFTLDLEGRIIFISPQVRRYGYDPEEIRNTHFLDYIQPADRRMVLSGFYHSFHRSSHTTLHFLSKDGNQLVMEEKGYALSSRSGELQGHSGILRDVTEYKQAEEAIFRAERLMGVDYLAAGVAHQFNNIHASLIGYLDLLSIQDDLSIRSRRFISHIQQAAQRATDVTRNMAAFARLEKSKKGTVCLNQILESTFRLIREEMESEGISLSLILEEKLCPIQAHAGEISQVILNLLINAHHSLTSSPVKKIAVVTGRKGNRAFLSIADSGCGIPPNDLHRIFMPFYSTKGEYCKTYSKAADQRGLGLGLSICSSIVAEHNGEIRVESSLQQGSTFIVLLPLASTQMQETLPLPTPSTSDLRGKRILLLEDDKMIRKIYAQTLRHEGFIVKTTDNGFTALKWLKGCHFDLVLLDLKMPIMDGIQFLESVKVLPMVIRPRLVIVSGLSPKNQPSLDHYSLAIPPLQKPLPLAELVLAIRQAFGHLPEG